MARTVIVAVLAISLLLLSGTALARQASESGPPELTTPLTSTLIGARAGSFAHFQFDFRSGIIVEAQPAMALTFGAFGFRVFHDGTEVGKGQRQADDPNQLVFTLTGQPTGTYLVQVFNYLQDSLVTYTIRPVGGVRPVLENLPGGATPEAAAPLGGTVSTSLVGNRAGSFAFYTLEYTGEESKDLEFILSFSPWDPISAMGVGMNIYKGRTLVTSVNQTTRPGQMVLTLTDGDPGTYILQLYNYTPGMSMSYHLETRGLVARPSLPTPTPSPSPTMAPPAPEEPGPAPAEEEEEVTEPDSGG